MEEIEYQEIEQTKQDSQQPNKAVRTAEEKFVVVEVQGGLGKHVAATAVLKGIRKKYPDRALILVCAYPEIFLYSDLVDRVYALGQTPYFYENYIKDKDTIVLKHDPYGCTNHIHQKQHVIQSWFEVFGLQYEGELPSLSTNYRLLELTVFNLKTRLADKFGNNNKPLMVIQTNGGPLAHQMQEKKFNVKNIYSWARDMPLNTAAAIVNHYKQQYNIIQVCKHESNVIDGVLPLIDPQYNTQILALASLSDKRLLIDSCIQHAAAAFKKRSTVLWNGTNPTVFGYAIHDNILPKREPMQGYKNMTAYLYEYELWGDPIQCPYDSNDLYDINLIIKSIDSQ